MAFYHRIPVRRMSIISASYFALFGLLLFIASFRDAGFRCDAAIVFACLVLPLVFHHRIVHAVMGLLFTIVSGYFVLACTFIWIVGYEEGIYMRTWEFAFASLIALCSFACSLALLYVGSRRRVEQKLTVH